MEPSLANASEQFRQSDVTRWAIVALTCAGLAVLAANVSALLPRSMLDGLHLTRLEGASVEHLRGQVAVIEEELRTLRQENRQLLSRFAHHEEQGNDATRRIGALEVTLPRLMETASANAGIDSLSTASIDATGGTGDGTAVVRQTPLDPQPIAPLEQTIPEPIEETTASLAPLSDVKFGIALGSAVPVAQAPAAWDDLSVKLGPLLLGLEPLLAEAAVGDDKYIIAGPFEQMADATVICGRLERVSIPCLPMPYKGTAFLH